jgi:hypothetical protein
MEMVRVRFLDRETEARAIARLVRRHRAVCLPEGEFEISEPALAALDELGMVYEVVAREGLDHALKALRAAVAA